MLGIYFFTYRGEYIEEPVWEGEKGVVIAPPVNEEIPPHERVVYPPERRRSRD